MRQISLEQDNFNFVQTSKLALFWQILVAKFAKTMMFLSNLIVNFDSVSTLQTFFEFHSKVLTGFDLTGFFGKFTNTILDFLQFLIWLIFFVLLLTSSIFFQTVFSNFDVQIHSHLTKFSWNFPFVLFFRFLINSSNWEWPV